MLEKGLLYKSPTKENGIRLESRGSWIILIAKGYEKRDSRKEKIGSQVMEWNKLQIWDWDLKILCRTGSSNISDSD